MKGNREIRNLGPFKIRNEVSFKKQKKTENMNSLYCFMNLYRNIFIVTMNIHISMPWF